MSNDRGGRRIKIIVQEYAYPHSNSAKENGVGQVFPIIDTGFVRPTNAMELFVQKSFDSKLFEELVVFHAISKYRLSKIGEKFEHVETKI